MAIFRNVSGRDRQLALPELGEVLEVPKGACVPVPDDVALAYDFSQGGVWEVVEAAVVPQDATDATVETDETLEQDGTPQ